MRNLIGLSVAICLLAASGAHAECGARHFYSYTNGRFTVSMHGGLCDGLDSSGKPVTGAHDCTTFGAYTGGGSKNTTAATPFGPVITMHYPNGPLTSSITVSGGAYYPTTNFSIQQIGQRCIVEHSGNTGNIVVNNPTEGDIVTCGPRTYACKLSK